MPRKAVDPPSLKMFKTQRDTALSKLLEVTLSGVKRAGRDNGQRFLPPHLSCDPNPRAPPELPTAPKGI